jgi:thiol:disulfide interchange protein DsbD
MNMAAFRLLALVLTVTTSATFFNIASAGSLSDGIDNIFGKLTGAEQPEFLDPDEAFIVSAEAVSGNEINVQWQIADGYYLYKDKFKFSIQNDNIREDDKLTITDVKLPEGKLKNDPDFGSVWVNYHDVDARLTIQGNEAAVSTAELLVNYQGCKEDVLCYPPISKTLPINLIASVAAQTSAGEDGTGVAEPGTKKLSAQDVITEHLSDGAFLQNIIIFFGFGLLLALTPCVFPMIPILSGIIVGQGSSMTTLRSFYISLTYVIAIALTYAILGVVAGSFDLNLQAASQNIWVITAFSAVFVLLALSMFGFYELQLPASWQNKLSGVSGKQGGTLHGVAVMGVLSAIIVGPCIAPPLAGALLYISQTGNAVLGGSALFAMGLGMGVPLLVIGTSAGKLLPKAGAWMETIKHIFGVLMLAVAVWFMERVLPGGLALALWALLFIVTAIYMGALDRSERQSQWQGLWRGLGLAILVYGMLLMIGAASGGSNMFKPLQGLLSNNQTGEVRSDTLPFQMIKGVDGLQSVLDQAASEDKYVMLDFYADWCITCKEMEHKTFTDPGVHQMLSNVVLLQADVTENDELDKALLKKFSLYGPPAILFFNKQGVEEKTHRLVGFMKTEKFLKHISEVISD